MLKALELNGFKSFAERTRFEFPRGITVVVGPNGSGKSNVVDAIKWVLGEQSVKSLRGKEMADVIFNGSSSRRLQNTAEVTLTFDNSERLLAVDAPEVQITRRVYRSGEGEYQINRQPCRLRDIRDLFSGTGVATDAYSVIEQGKVDGMLQSSPRERRVIFEEAAGISRFKLKRLEAMRRLDRVEQNLLRLSDIVDEVENRLKSVRLQAAKARRYKEYADRLQQLRTQVALADWRNLGNQLSVAESELTTLQTEVTSLASQAELSETNALEFESQLAEIDAAIRNREAHVAQNRERIISLESNITHNQARTRELEEQVSRDRLQLASMSVQAGSLEQQLQEVAVNVHSAETRHRTISSLLSNEQKVLDELTATLDRLIDQQQKQRAAHLEAMRVASSLSNDAGVLQTRAGVALANQQRLTQRTIELESALQKNSDELAQLDDQLLAAQEAVETKQASLLATRAQINETRNALEEITRELTQLNSRHTAATERAAVLDELEQRFEGLDSGVKQILIRARESAAGPYDQVRGLLADLLQVNFESAPFIEAALGDRAQAVVVGDRTAWWEFIRQQQHVFSGRVCFLNIDQAEVDASSSAEMLNFPGIVGRADQYVEVSPEFLPLVQSLLSRFWVVQDLAQAMELAKAVAGHNFVTLAGEIVSADGSLTVGPPNARLGIISRRSELRTLREQLVGMAEQITSLEAKQSLLHQKIEQENQDEQAQSSAFRIANEELTKHQLHVTTAQQRQTELTQARQSVDEELQAANLESEGVQKQIEEVTQLLSQAQQQVTDIEKQIQEAAEQIQKTESQRDERRRQATKANIELAKSEHQLETLRTECQRYEQDQQQRLRRIVTSREQLEQTLQKIYFTEGIILSASSQLALLYLDKESEKSGIAYLVDSRLTCQQQRTKITQEAQKIRSRLRRSEEKLHKKNLVVGELRYERQGLVDRLRDEYNLELALLDHEIAADEEVERQSVDAEITDLRQKIGSIGGVNLEALDELEQLESRYLALSGQFQDLSSAKVALEQIISKINADSRRLFMETLEVIRGHFQTLFRNLFGGGQADIVLEQSDDLLESGIEIVARPPGKEPRNISLLSGGEKTMTCVALLLAIFRSRPSPFCVLDEVDAALDEANIERFVNVLREFLNWTQFIVVTHSKKTMTCANTLYGVTMQESGVSKRVSVRFEDVSDNGEIRFANRDTEADDSGSSTGPSTDSSGIQAA